VVHGLNPNLLGWAAPFARLLVSRPGWASFRLEANSGCTRDIPNEKTGYAKTIWTEPKPISSRFRILYPVFRTDFVFVRKYEFDRDKCRNRCGTERDISRPFSTLVTEYSLRFGK
jgi:hypothetical protein